MITQFTHEPPSRDRSTMSREHAPKEVGAGRSRWLQAEAGRAWENAGLQDFKFGGLWVYTVFIGFRGFMGFVGFIGFYRVYRVL